jgi:hypothetical protein
MSRFPRWLRAFIPVAALVLCVSACGNTGSSNSTAQLDQASAAYLKANPKVAKAKEDLEKSANRCVGTIGLGHVYRDLRHNHGQKLEACMGLPNNVNSMFLPAVNQTFKERGFPHNKKGVIAFVSAITTKLAIKLDKANKKATSSSAKKPAKAKGRHHNRKKH